MWEGFDYDNVVIRFQVCIFDILNTAPTPVLAAAGAL